MKITDKEFREAFNKCIKNGVRIYPEPLPVSSFKVVPRVHLIVDSGSDIKRSDKSYSQGSEMTNKIVELYAFIAKSL